MLQKTPFGYTRKDVLLIGLGITLLGIGLKSGLEVPSFFAYSTSFFFFYIFCTSTSFCFFLYFLYFNIFFLSLFQFISEKVRSLEIINKWFRFLVNKELS